MNCRRKMICLLAFCLSLLCSACGTGQKAETTQETAGSTMLESAGTEEERLTESSTASLPEESESPEETKAQESFPIEAVRDCSMQVKDIRDEETKILCIGNSFTVDTLEYAERMLLSMDVTDVKLGKLVLPGRTLSDHARNAYAGAAVYELGVSSGEGGWLTSFGVSMGDALLSENWDLVILQQYYPTDGTPAAYEEGAEPLIAFVRKHIHPEAEIGWNATWSYRTGCIANRAFDNFGFDQQCMYDSIVTGIREKILTNPNIDTVLYSCTAVQNLKTSYVGESFYTADGFHMSTDRGRFLVAMNFIRQVLGLPIGEIRYLPPGVSDGFRKAAEEAVDHAAAQPLCITESSYKEDPLDRSLPETQLFVNLAETENGANGLTFCYTEQGQLYPFTERNNTADQWFRGGTGALVYPHADRAQNYGVVGTAVGESVVMVYEAPCSGEMDVFLLMSLQGSAGQHGFSVKLAVGSPDNVCAGYSLSGTPGATREETYTVTAEKGQKLYIIYESTEDRYGEWVGYKNRIVLRTPEKTG